MAELIEHPTRIPVPGGKVINEYVGVVNTGDEALSVAHMMAPGGWVEPAQKPDFDELTVVLRGCVRVEHDGGVFDVRAGQAVRDPGGRARPLHHPRGRRRRVCCDLSAGVHARRARRDPE